MQVGIDAMKDRGSRCFPGHECARTEHLEGKENSPLRKVEAFSQHLLVPDFSGTRAIHGVNV